MSDRSQPLVSIILVIHNGVQFLPENLKSIFEEADADCEIIVFDNHSTDSSVEYILKNFPSVKIITSESNLGFATGCNLASMAAQGTFLVFLNQDVIGYEGWLTELINGFEDPKIGLTTSKIVILGQDNTINSCGLDIHYTGLSFTRCFGQNDGCFHQQNVSAVNGASFAISNKLWRQLGGFDTDFFMYFEETDLSWRAQQLGYYCLFVPSSVIAHNYSREKSLNCLYFSERNRKFMILKNYHLITIILILPALILSEVLQWLNMSTRGWKAIFSKLRADLWILRNIKTILMERKIQSSKGIIRDYEILAQRSYQIDVLEKRQTRFVQLALPIVNLFYRLIYFSTIAVLKSLKT